jgi:sporulation protein YlmC with PRC-barrel domain
MLITHSNLINRPVQSLHTGSELARTIAAVVDFNDLRVIAFDIDGPVAQQAGVNLLMTADIREVSPLGLIVDSVDVLTVADDVVRVKEIKDLHFHLLGLKVETKRGRKLGTITDFTADAQTFVIQQLIIKRPALKSLLDPELTIARDQIVEVNDYKIIIKDDTEKPKAKAPVKAADTASSFVPNYVNPFRNPEFVESQVPEPGNDQTPAA